MTHEDASRRSDTPGPTVPMIHPDAHPSGAHAVSGPTLPAPRPRPPRHHDDEDAAIRGFAIEAARLISDLHCEDVIIIDVRSLSDVTDYLVLATGTSDVQIRSLGHAVEDLARQHGLSRFGRDADARAAWLALDFIDVVVHLFDQQARAHYDLEMLWGDAPRVPWHRSR